MSDRALTLILFSLGTLLASCCSAPSPGVVSDALPDSSFAPQDIELMLYCGEFGVDGLCRVGLDGSNLQPLAAATYYLQDASDDGHWLALSDQDTNLYLARGDGTGLRAIPQLAGRTSDAEFSPDSRTLAAVRHADYHKPQYKWVDEDTLYLIDVQTAAVTSIGKSVDDFAVSLQWTTSGGVYMDMFETPDQLVSVSTGKRAPGAAPANLRVSPMHDRPTTCPTTLDHIEEVGFGGDGGLNLVSASGTEAPLVVVTGRERGFHDHLSTVDWYYFTDGCEYVVFDLDRSVWVVEVASGKVGPITQGRESFPAP